MNTKRDLRIAIVGCGAVAAVGHKPAILNTPDCRLAALVDSNSDLAAELAQGVDGAEVFGKHLDLIGRADAAVLALPHHLHADVSCDLLEAGIHVLVEKPMAMSAAECERMIAASKRGGALLAVGLMRRFLHSARFARWAIKGGLLGEITSFDFREGNVYNWPVRSDFFWRKETAGGGVLFDTGAHTLDLLLWWLGPVARFEYFDDSYGGVEADCKIQLTLESGASGEVHLSRTRLMRNSAVIHGEKAIMEVDLRKNSLAIRSHDGTSIVSGPCCEPTTGQPVEQSFTSLFYPQMADWVGAIQSHSQPTVPGTEAIDSIRLIEACYANRRLLELPWMHFNKAAI